MALPDLDTPKKAADQQQHSPPKSLHHREQEPADEDDECELTNLNWLTELKNVGYIQLAEGPVDVPLTRFNKFLDELKTGQEKFKRDQLFYKHNGDDKPPFNYAHLIGIGLLENGRMTLQQVYDWIQDNFMFYRMCGTNWQSSIRHNLSLGFFFKNTARGDNERGKGGYWELALDSRKTEWKRNRKSRKNRHQQQQQQQQNSNSSRTLRKSPLKSINSFVTKSKRPVRRFKFAANNGKRDKKFKDENENENENCHSPLETELILTVEAQSEEYFSNRITEDTPVEFIHDFNLNNQIFQASEVPQPIDDVEVPFFSTISASSSSAATSSSSPPMDSHNMATNCSPNVIVETLPYHFPPLEEYNFATAFNEQKIFEDLLEYENELM